MNTEAIMPQTSDFKKNLNINIDLRGLALYHCYSWDKYRLCTYPYKQHFIIQKILNSFKITSFSEPDTKQALFLLLPDFY